MTALTKPEKEELAAALAARKARLLDEIRRALARTKNERYADLLAGGSDAGDESVADLLSEVAQAEVARDIVEVRAIGYKRLQAYPTAKRCLHCQEQREKRRASAPHSRF